MASKPIVVKVIRRTESPIKNPLITLEENEITEEEELENPFNITELFDSNDSSDIPTIFETKGVITEENGEISIVYETRLDEPMPTVVTYSFQNKQRNVLAVRKSSLSETVSFYETKRKSQNLSDISKIIDGDSTCFTKILKNYITYAEGGYIELEYYIELNGELFEYNKEYFIVEPIK